MLSVPDVAILGGLALLLFGPERLPRIARDAGRVMRELQNTSQSFMREIERVAEVDDEARATAAFEPTPAEPALALEPELPADAEATAAAPEAAPPPAPHEEPAPARLPLHEDGSAMEHPIP